MIFNQISLLFHLFFIYLSCSCPYIHKIVHGNTEQLACAGPLFLFSTRMFSILYMFTLLFVIQLR